MISVAVTIKDIAAQAGVSPSTVSRVCNDNPSISKETRDRVRKVMAELGYEPGTPTAAPTVNAIRMVGIVLPPSMQSVYRNPFFLETIRGICEFCNPHGVVTSIVTSASDEEAMTAVKRLVSSRQIDGFIFLYSKQDDPVVEYLCEEGILYVVVGTPQQFRSQTVCIDNDNLSASREATDFLCQLGHKRIGFIGSNSSFYHARERKAGYQLSLMQHGLTIDPSIMLEFSNIAAEGTDRVQGLLSRPDRPTAILTDDDILALVLEQQCINMGLKIPEDISILSFNNSLYTSMTASPLTCVDVNSFQLGYEAASQIINHVENPNLMATKILVPHRFIDRGSCCAPKQAI